MLEPVSPLTPATPSHEKPLPPLRYTLYLILASLLIAGFYIYSIAALLLGSVLWLTVIAFALLGTTYGGLTILGPALGALGGALFAFARGLRLKRGVTYRVPLARDEAPQLWAIVEDLARRLQVAPPREILLQNGVDAWVQLLGAAKGRGKSKLGIGFDLLAGLPPSQARAVVAHEIAHAKHVRRGYRGFLIKGVARCEQCSASLQAMARDGNSSGLARGISGLLGAAPKKIGMVGGKLMAACSRYDEFLADRVAAQICGPHEARQALLAVHVLDAQSENISWRERILHLERAPGYTAWLRQSLHVPDDAKRLEIEARALEQVHHDEMSTHPSLSDRLAALEEVAAPLDDWTPGSLQSGADFLHESDASAKKLLREIERIIAEEERKATQSLARFMKKQSGRNDGDAARRFYSGALLVTGLLFLFPMLAVVAETGWTPGWVLGIFLYLGSVSGASWFIVQSGKNAVSLPVPTLLAFRVAAELKQDEKRALGDLELKLETLPPAEKRAREVRTMSEQEDKNAELGARLRPLLPATTAKPKAIANFWAQLGAESLSNCEYEKAAHCARLAFEAQSAHPTALLIHAVCHAFDGDQTVRSTFDLALTRSPNTSGRWAMAWANCLLGEYNIGEAFLLDLTRKNTRSPILWALLGRCQAANSKPREALGSHRRAVELARLEKNPDNEACHRFELAQNLSALGSLGEAKAELDWLQQKREAGPLSGIADFDLETEWLGWHLANGDVPLALEMAHDLANRNGEPRHLLELGDALVESRDEPVRLAAQDYYQRALEGGFYPQALLALAKITFDAGDRTSARRLILEALDTTRPMPFDAAHPLAILDGALSALRTLADKPPQKVTAFAVHLDVRQSALDLKKLSLLCLYSEIGEARAAATEIFAALLPAYSLENKISWENASPEMQPDGPAPPGIYFSAFEAQ